MIPQRIFKTVPAIGLQLAVCHHMFCHQTACAQVEPLPISKPNPYNEMAPGEPDLDNLIEHGQAYYAIGNRAAAEDAFTRYTAKHPLDPYGFYWLGKLAFEDGRTNEGVNLFVKSEDLAKVAGMDSGELRNNLGNGLVGMGYVKEAVYDLQRAVAIDPKNAFTHFNLAKLLALKGEFDQALVELHTATELGLNEPTIPLYRSLLFKKLGRVADSKNEATYFLQSGQIPEGDLRTFAQTLANQ